MINYKINPEILADATGKKQTNLAKNKPDADFIVFASGIVYDRLKKRIMHYREYGPYWWALKDVLRRQGYNVGDDNDEDIASNYIGATDAETITAADMFYESMSGQVAQDNNKWTLHPKKPEYTLYDGDMETRRRISDPIEN